MSEETTTTPVGATSDNPNPDPDAPRSKLAAINERPTDELVKFDQNDRDLLEGITPGGLISAVRYLASASPETAAAVEKLLKS